MTRVGMDAVVKIDLDNLPDFKPTEFYDIRSAYFDEQAVGTYQIRRPRVLEGDPPELYRLFYSDDEDEENIDFSGFVSVLKPAEDADAPPADGRKRERFFALDRCYGHYCVLKNLPTVNWTADQLKSELLPQFRKFGRCIYIDVGKSKNPDRLGERYIYCDYKQAFEAQLAVQMLDKFELHGHFLDAIYKYKQKRLGGPRNVKEAELYVNRVLLTPNSQVPFVVRIDGLPYDYTKKELYDMAAQVGGNIVDHSIFGQKERPENGSFGIIAFADDGSSLAFIDGIKDGSIKDEYYPHLTLSAEAITSKENESRLRNLPCAFGFISQLSTVAKRRDLGLVTLLVKEIDKEVTEEDMYTLFSRCGTVEHIFIKHDLTKVKNLDCTFGYVRYSDRVSATRAALQLNDTVLKGRRIRVNVGKESEEDIGDQVRFHRRRRLNLDGTEVINEYPLHLGNLSLNVTKRDIRALCEPFGVVADITLGRGPRYNCRGSTFSLVKFREIHCVYRAAKELNLTTFMDKKLAAQPSRETCAALKQMGMDEQELLRRAEAKEKRENARKAQMPRAEEFLLWRLADQWKLFANLFQAMPLPELINKIHSTETKIYQSVDGEEDEEEDGNEEATITDLPGPDLSLSAEEVTALQRILSRSAAESPDRYIPQEERDATMEFAKMAFSWPKE